MEDFATILEDHRVPLAPNDHHHARSGWIQFDCPFCGEGTHGWHMGFNKLSCYVNCWRCGPHDLTRTIQAILHCSYDKAKELRRSIQKDREPSLVVAKTCGTLRHPSDVGVLQKAHRSYLKNRGFLDIPELESLWKLKGTGPLSVLKTKDGSRIRSCWRVLIPVFHKAREVSWIARSIQEKETLRYLSAPPDCEVLPHKSLLYGFDYVRHSVLVVEGVTDCWKVGPGTVATFGTSFSASQQLSLSTIPRRFVCFDAEPLAQARARSLCESLSAFPGETHNILLETGKDPCEASSKEVRQLQKLLWQ